MTISWLADKIEQWPTAKLVPYARNSRTHSDAQVAQIAASIAEFGFTNPILAGGDGVIVAGHGRLAAAQKLGLTMVPVVVLDHLTTTQRRALVIADNRIAENAGWDEAMLQVELAALQDDQFDLALTGFDADALADLLAGEETTTEGDTDEDAVPDVAGTVVSRAGDGATVWQQDSGRRRQCKLCGCEKPCGGRAGQARGERTQPSRALASLSRAGPCHHAQSLPYPSMDALFASIGL